MLFYAITGLYIFAESPREITHLAFYAKKEQAEEGLSMFEKTYEGSYTNFKIEKYWLNGTPEQIEADKEFEEWEKANGLYREGG